MIDSYFITANLFGVIYMANAFQMPWVDMIKPEIVNIGDGIIELAQTPDDLHKNHNGDMHAAVLFTMLEMAGLGVVTLFLGDAIKDSFVVLKDLHIFYDERAQGRIIFKGELSEEQKIDLKTSAENNTPIEQEITAVALDENGLQVSHATMTAIIKPKKES